MIDSLDRIKQMEQALSFGTLHLTIKRHDSQTVAIDGNISTSHKVSDNPGALAIIITLLKAAEANGTTGNITCTLSLADGEATRVIVEEVHRTPR